MMHRFPSGVTGEKVHQKRVPHGAPAWLETVRVDFPRYGRHADLRHSLALPGELVVPREPLPVRLLQRHDADPGYVDRESRRNYDGVLRGLHAS